MGVTKNTVLIILTYGASLVLGLLTLWVAYPNGININSADLVVNAMCVSLMKKRWDGLYRCFCRFPDTCVNTLMATTELSMVHSDPSSGHSPLQIGQQVDESSTQVMPSWKVSESSKIVTNSSMMVCDSVSVQANKK